MPGFFQQALDLPLGERSPTRWIGWLAAALVAVAVLATALAAAASTAASREALAPILVTVVLPARDGGVPTDGEVARVVASLSAVPGVAFARPVTAAELGLVAAGDAQDAAAIPRFVDLALNPGRTVDLDTLGARVAEIMPGATVAPGERQVPGNRMPAALVRDFALVAVVVALAILALGVAGLTRLSLVLHRETIDLLRQLGADDGYIARQLGQHALGGVLRGGFLGLMVALPAFLVIAGLAGDRLPPLALAPLDWLVLALIPPLAAVLARLAAGLAARPRLR